MNISTVADKSEDWGYVQVRPKAHMFWWLYRSPERLDNASNPWPLVLWLQGGPGASGVGVGNFMEIGPLDANLMPRNSTWLQLADLLFVDSPVGTGYSYVEDEELLVKSDEEVGKDMTVLLKELFNGDEKLQESPLYIISESYGGKYALLIGLSVVQAIQSGDLKLKLGGVAIGNGWISPEDFVLSWGPLLRGISRIDENGLNTANRLAKKFQEQLRNSQHNESRGSFFELVEFIKQSSNSVDMYNFLLDSSMDPMEQSNDKLSVLMNGAIREKLTIIPTNVTWVEQSIPVYNALKTDFLKPSVNEVDEILLKGINVTVYNGHLDVFCPTIGVEAWIQKLRWDGLKNFNNSSRTPIYCDNDKATKGFTKSYKNLQYYSIFGAGHYVPADQPCVALKMLGEITQSPAAVTK